MAGKLAILDFPLIASCGSALVRRHDATPRSDEADTGFGIAPVRSYVIRVS